MITLELIMNMHKEIFNIDHWGVLRTGRLTTKLIN